MLYFWVYSSYSMSSASGNDQLITFYTVHEKDFSPQSVTFGVTSLLNWIPSSLECFHSGKRWFVFFSRPCTVIHRSVPPAWCFYLFNRGRERVREMSTVNSREIKRVFFSRPPRSRGTGPIYHLISRQTSARPLISNWFALSMRFELWGLQWWEPTDPKVLVLPRRNRGTSGRGRVSRIKVNETLRRRCNSDPKPSFCPHADYFPITARPWAFESSRGTAVSRGFRF